MIGIEADAQYAGFRRNDDCDDFGGFGCFGGLGRRLQRAGDGVAGCPIGLGAAPASFSPAILRWAEPTWRCSTTPSTASERVTRNDIEWFGTVRGRLGYAVDRLLIYVTGGLAFTSRDNDNGNNSFVFGTCGFGPLPMARRSRRRSRTRSSASQAARDAATLVNPTSTFLFNERNNNNNIGWTVGGGIEYAFTPNWTVKLEGLYVNFEGDRRRNNNLPGQPGGGRDQHGRAGDSHAAGL